MTEKRYSLVYYADKGGAFIKNNETGTEWYHDSRSSLLEIVNELNGLSDENEQLKSDNKIYVKRYGELFDEYTKLKKENKELKKEIESLKMEIAELRESEKDNYNITDGLW